MRQRIDTEVVVVGGGVTGAGILRDLALRGIQAILVEQRDLGHGTSSRNHGLLHSGARYAVKDEEAALESYKENLIIKKTIPGSVEQTGGLFVKVPEDDMNYVKSWLSACSKLGIPAEEIPVQQALKLEPYLSKEIEAAYRVPDGAIDGFTLVVDLVADAASHGAKALTYHEVVEVLRDQASITGVVVQNRYTGEKTEINAKFVVNAAGPWGEQIAAMAEVSVPLIKNKGMLAIFNKRFNRQVINRLRIPGDADIFVPAHNVTIFGTTGINVEDPNDFSLDRSELEQMLAEGSQVVPGLSDMRMIRAFSGSRPLYQELGAFDASGRSVTRGIALLDHLERDGLEGFITITGGKLTTFRYMAEQTVDLICSKLNVHQPCTTHEEVVPHRDASEYFKKVDLAPAAKSKIRQWAGMRAETIETNLRKPDELRTVVCECEQVTWAEVEANISKDGRFNIGDIRRRTRLGMGPCQGTFCNYRAAALAVQRGAATYEEAEWTLLDTIKERRKGMNVVSTGETAKQMQLMDTLYRVSLGIKEGN